MIECPYCGVCWDYVSILPMYAKDYSKQKERYIRKEQADCMIHITYDHSTMLIAEMLAYEIDSLKEMVKQT